MNRAIALVVAAICAATCASASVVYDNTTSYTGMQNGLLLSGETNSTEHGNTVTLAGTDRVVTEIDVYLGVFCCGAAQFDAQVRFYANDGPDGRPGGLLWTSEPVIHVIDSGNPDPIPILYFFQVPNIAVPDAFTWTIQLTNRQGNLAPMGPSEFNPPTVGRAPFGFWRPIGGPTEWEFTGVDEPPFGARVTAVQSAGDVCSLPADPGPCDGICPRFFHNPDTNQCEEFIWGCCGGNANNFPTLEACEAVCPGAADITGPGGVPDGCVDAFDLGAMLGAWCSAVNDPNPPSPPCENCTPANLDVADISGPAKVPDGCVDPFDLAKLLADWCSVAGGNPCGTCGPPPP